MTDLTEKWKNGELKFGAYYVNRLEEHRIWLYNDRSKTPESQHEIYEIIASVPSYQEYLDSEAHCAVYSEVNKQLRELLKECKANFIHRKQLLEKLEELEKPTIDILTRINAVIGESEE